MGGVRISTYDPIRNQFAALLGEAEGRTSLPTKIAAALTAGVSRCPVCLCMRLQAFFLALRRSSRCSSCMG